LFKHAYYIVYASHRWLLYHHMKDVSSRSLSRSLASCRNLTPAWHERALKNINFMSSPSLLGLFFFLKRCHAEENYTRKYLVYWMLLLIWNNKQRQRSAIKRRNGARPPKSRACLVEDARLDALVRYGKWRQ
jgi:hypothetical protein